MRIRKRPQPPPPSPPPPPPPAPDPSPRLPPRPTGRVAAWGGEERSSSRSGAGVEGWGGGGVLRGLHPDGDLRIDPHRGPRVDPWPDASRPNGSCIPPPDPALVQGSQEVVKKLEEVEMEVESNNKMGSAQVNGNKRGDGSSGAQRSEAIGGCGEEEKAHQPDKSAVGYDDGGGGDWLDKLPVGRDRKAKTKARVNATTAPSTVNASIGPSSEKKSDEVVEREERVAGVGKKRRSPAVLMEGSRCSRVNGRGWRCCQQTLVGYSLCEHHLGKGRLRSMSSVRGQLGTSKPLVNADMANGSKDSSPSSQQEQEQLYMDASNGKDDEKQEKKKRKKIGMVKARSISSLLDETNHSVESMQPTQAAAAAQEPEAAVEPADALRAMV